VGERTAQLPKYEAVDEQQILGPICVTCGQIGPNSEVQVRLAALPRLEVGALNSDDARVIAKVRNLTVQVGAAHEFDSPVVEQLPDPRGVDRECWIASSENGR